MLVVVKLLLFSPDFTWEQLKLFEREAEVLKFIEHPAIPQYLDYFDVEMGLGKGFALVQTYIEAKSFISILFGTIRFRITQSKISHSLEIFGLRWWQLTAPRQKITQIEITPSYIIQRERRRYCKSTS
ncbi:hypothetical protein [Okeania sp. SIO1F9]|uniref:hypothetical protein n=1 Tax=Okeania sp. SIO1F9 TaxID=2607813 RepID=UPI0033900930